jgi:hypothetical protein
MSRLKIIALALMFHAALVAPSTVYAQLEAPPEAAQIQLGPVALYPSLQIVDAGRDRNVFNEETNPKEDFTLTAASRALAVVKLGGNELLFSTGNDYVWFRQYAEERSSNTRYAARFNLSASRFKPFVGVDRQHTRSRPNPEIDARARRLERSAIAGFNVNITDRTALTASAQVSDSRFDKGEQFRGVDLAYALNRTGHSATAGVRYALTPLTLLAIVGNYAEDRFPDSHLRDSRSYSVMPTLEFSPDASIRGRFSAGIEKFQPLDASLPAHLGPIFEASLNWSLFGRTTFDVNGTRDTRYSYQDIAPYYLLTGARLNIAQRLFGPVDLLGGADLQHLSYRWHYGATSDATAINETQLLKVFSGGVGVNVGHGFRITVSGERTERRSPQDPRQNFQRNRLLSSVTIGS